MWHGFTQMASYLDNAPVIVDHAEGRELVDVDGRRYLDAISSLWVNTLGHRVPELDAAVTPAARPPATRARSDAGLVTTSTAKPLTPARARRVRSPLRSPHPATRARRAITIAISSPRHPRET